MSHSAFNLLARPIQHILWDMGWESLRPIQVDAIRSVLEGSQDIIISARTAAGKTEAAFLPILSHIYNEPAPSIQALYVGPLKALINDQFRRLEELCRRAEIPVHRWHGDVDAAKKRALLDQPGGVLLITPESVESLFVNRSGFLPQLFRHLAFVVIDEIHALVGRERGTHLRSLLFRLQRFVKDEFRIVGLSATIGDAMSIYSAWMRPGQPDHVLHIHDPGEQKSVLYRIHGYIVGTDGEEQALGGEDEDLAEKGGILPPQIIEDMYESFVGKTNLIFANNKQDVEAFADALNEHCRQKGRPPEFLVHHGSLSKEVREHAETVMREDRPCTTVCSATLELGIDIGRVTAVGQIDPPWSVSSLVQRLGRSGRGEGEPQTMRVYVLERKPDARSRLVDRLYPGLLRAVAVTELMLERWVEPPSIDVLDLSTFVQQILSVLAETGGISASRLYDILVTNGAFRKIPRSIVVGVLRSLGRNGLVEQMPDGDLILAPAGERVVNDYEFYSAFATPIEYAVVHGGRPIGRLPALAIPAEGDHFLLAARRWEVLDVDHDRCEILVSPAKGKKPPRFQGSVGEIHPRVREMMRAVLLGSKAYPYLNATAMQLLEEARRAAGTALLPSRPLLALGERDSLWFTWTGTKIQRTLCLMASMLGLEAIDQDIAIHFHAGVDEVIRGYAELVKTAPDPGTLAERILTKQIRKFDKFLSDDILTTSLACDAIDVPQAIALARNLASQPSPARNP